ncbi:MAG: MFS transporter [Actinomycetota bacterium]|nr:MFS transporter [Actinomycetota bacterium]
MTQTAAPRRQAPRTRVEQVLLVGGIVLLAVNLRPAVTSLGTVLEDVREGLALSGATAGLLTTLPVLCFATFGSLTPAAAHRFGMHRVVVASLLVMVTGLMGRALTDSPALFVVLSGLALAGMAAGNVLLPPLVKRHFPRRVSLVTAVYSTGLLGGAALPTLITIPAAEATGTWRWALLLWGLTAAVALLPWLALLRHDVRHERGRSSTIAWSALVRTRLAWAMAGFFGLQSMLAYAQFGWVPQIYRDAGLSPAVAALMLGLVTVAGIPLPLALPTLVRRWPDQRPVVAILGACGAAGFAGLLASPTTLPWLWALLMGIGGGAFPWLLTMLGLRTATGQGAAALSGFVQSVGYLLATLGPFLTGVLYDMTDGWTVPLVVLALLCVPQILLGLLFARPGTLEAELARR